MYNAISYVCALILGIVIALFFFGAIAANNSQPKETVHEFQIMHTYKAEVIDTNK